MHGEVKYEILLGKQVDFRQMAETVKDNEADVLSVSPLDKANCLTPNMRERKLELSAEI